MARVLVRWILKKFSKYLKIKLEHFKPNKLTGNIVLSRNISKISNQKRYRYNLNLMAKNMDFILKLF